MPISRRTFLQASAATGLATTLGPSLTMPAAAAKPWPSADKWDALRRAVGGRLIEPKSPLAPCLGGADDAACASRIDAMQNPFFIQDEPGAQQTNGWLNAWTAEVSPYAVAAETTGDIVAAVNFARENGVKLVVKGCGHDYLGRNCAADSLLVWTHKMRDTAFDEAFRITGDPDAEAVPALTAGAGTRWLEAYQLAAANKHYVQGGGCTTVGVAGGFIQGGGFGSFSKHFGTGAGSVLEYEVVTADGNVLIANKARNSDLFWALRGGGGGTFGIVSKVTLLAHPIPHTMGILQGELTAKGDDAFRALIAKLIGFYHESLENPHWGEQIAIKPDNTIELFMVFLNTSADEARAVWAPFFADLDATAHPITHKADFRTVPFDTFFSADAWDKREPGFVLRDTREGANPELYWWEVNKGEIAEFINSYQSRWVPADRFAPENADGLAQVLFEASRHTPMRLQINKGLAGAPEEVLARERETSLNPAAIEAATIIIFASRQPQRFPGVAGHEPDMDAGRAEAAKIDAAAEVLKEAFPEGGVYGNECDYFISDWKNEIYGTHYDRLLAIKQRYDPQNLFRVHHGVGSDA
ncbi:MAG: FAD-binding protein [Pseudomonadota bacterium]